MLRITGQNATELRASVQFYKFTLIAKLEWNRAQSGFGIDLFSAREEGLE